MPQIKYFELIFAYTIQAHKDLTAISKKFMSIFEWSPCLHVSSDPFTDLYKLKHEPCTNSLYF